MKRILCVASGGGHWEQLLLLQPAFGGCEVYYVTTLEGLLERSEFLNGTLVQDCNRNELVNTSICLAQLIYIFWRIRPRVVITTGAMPGLLAMLLGRIVGARTVWIDSVANAEEMSLSGVRARRFATLWMTQWEHVAAQSGANYAGSVL